MKNDFYVTTPIYYVNDVPHIGHAYSTVVADVFARYHRLAGDDVFFLTGTDEHGQKVAKAAEDRGLEPQEHVDRMVDPFKDLWRLYSISNDYFIRTTEERHQRVVQEIFQRLYDQGDIYKGTYEGWYCIHEENYWAEGQLVDMNCPDCGRPVKRVTEDSYFLKTSAYVDRLLAYIEANPNFIRPDVRRNEVVSFLKGGVQDVAVSRTAFRWGVPVPFDPEHVVYVWFDALINYLTGVGYITDDERFAAFWPPVHLIGKDILKFHAVIWPTMLMALGLELPKAIIATGFWTLGDQKISKSRGKVVDPIELADELGVDAVRYFLLREMPLGQDGEFTYERLVRRVNDDLANDFGNLIHRTLPMIKKYRNGVVPERPASTERTASLAEAATGIIAEYNENMRAEKPRDALMAVWRLLAAANKFIDFSEPWNLSKAGDTAGLDEVLWGLTETIRLAVLMTYPFMPATGDAAFEQLGFDESPGDKLFGDELVWGRLEGGRQTRPGSPLFPRIELEPKE